MGCRAADVPCVISEPAGGSECCQQEAKAATSKRTGQSDAGTIDADRQIVFEVEGLTCPAVKGLGCGHMLQGVLASLDEIDGVEASSANYTGTMIRVSVARGADRDRAAERVGKVLTEARRQAVRLAGDELKRALGREQWRGAGRIGELSAIEFHTLALHRVKTFAKAEKLEQKTADKLVEIARQHWERLNEDAKKDGATRPEDWGKRIRASLPAFLGRASEVLTAGQLERFRQALTVPCRDGDCPEAPPAPPQAEKATSRHGLPRGLSASFACRGGLPCGISIRTILSRLPSSRRSAAATWMV
jgi:hypothetical protein